MKKVFKLGLATVTAVILLVGSFALGAYASNWLSFTGDAQVVQTKDNIDEIMDILKRVNEDKITAEEALAELEALNPHELKEQIKRLKEELKNKTKEVENKQKEIQNKQKEIDDKNKEINQKNQENDELRRVIDQKDTKIDELNSTIEQKDNYINHLEKELNRANEKVADVHSKSNNAVSQAREYVK